MAPTIHLYEKAPDQSRQCLQSLVAQAKRLCRSRRMQDFGSLGELVVWIRSLPYLPDTDRIKAGTDGCDPHQRARAWPTDGINCREATTHYAAGVLYFGLPRGWSLEVWDLQAEQEPIDIGRGRVLQVGARHVFPRLRRPDGVAELVDLSSTVPRQDGAHPLANDFWHDLAHGTATGLDIAAPILGLAAGVVGGPAAGQAVSGLASFGSTELKGVGGGGGGQKSETRSEQADDEPRRRRRKKRRKARRS